MGGCAHRTSQNSASPSSVAVTLDLSAAMRLVMSFSNGYTPNDKGEILRRSTFMVFLKSHIYAKSSLILPLAPHPVMLEITKKLCRIEILISTHFIGSISGLILAFSVV